jgi:thioredoxin-related protein
MDSNNKQRGWFEYFFTIALVVCGLHLTLAISSKAAEETDKNIKNQVKWFGYTEAIEKAKKDKLPVLIVFYNDDCRKCEILEKNGFGRLDIADYVNEKFAPVRINGEKNNGLRKKYRVTVYPTVWFIDKDAKEIDALIGYVSPDRLLLILRYIGDEIYKKKSFSEYEKEQKK